MTLFAASALLLIYTETVSHVGAAESATVDLAIQRDGLTSWPNVQSSTMKGSLRDAAPRGRVGDYTDRCFVFGVDPNDTATNGDTKQSSPTAGTLAVGDAGLLAFPVASVAGIFGWVTCPQAIRDFKRVHGFLSAGPSATGAATAASGQPAPFDPFTWDVPDLKETEPARHAAGCKLFLDATADPKQLILQDIVLTAAEDDQVTAFADWLATNVHPGPPLLEAKLRRDLLLVADDLFAELVNAGVHIVTRVQIDDDSGTVGEGPWDEELLPAETILYAPLQARFFGNGTTNITSAAGVIDYVRTDVFGPGKRFQTGAGATIGWGIMAGTVYPVPAPGANGGPDHNAQEES